MNNLHKAQVSTNLCHHIIIVMEKENRCKNYNHYGTTDDRIFQISLF